MMRVHEMVAWTLVALLGLVVTAIAAGVIEGGPLNPPGPPASTNGVRPPGTPISSLPVTISTPGHYYLTSDLTVGPANGVLVLSSDVDIDMGGFTMHGTTSGIAFLLDNPFTNIRIYDGSMDGWLAGIDQAGDAATTRVEVDNVTISNTADAGIRLEENAVVRNCAVQTSGAEGIITGPNSIVEGCIVTEPTGSGITSGAQSTLRDCSVLGLNAGAVDGAAISVGDGSLVERCSVFNSQGAGIAGGNGVIVRDSVAASSSAGTGIGIAVGADSTVTGSVATSNAGSGIDVRQLLYGGIFHGADERRERNLDSSAKLRQALHCRGQRRRWDLCRQRCPDRRQHGRYERQ